MNVDFKEALRLRNVEPNSTWMRSDGYEMIVVMPDDDTAIQALCAQFACSYDQKSSADDPQWIKVIRLGLAKSSQACIDIYFVPFMCGQIDKGILTRIG